MVRVSISIYNNSIKTETCVSRNKLGAETPINSGLISEIITILSETDFFEVGLLGHSEGKLKLHFTM